MQRRASQLTIGYNHEWKQQSAWDTPLTGAQLPRAFPATSRNYLDIDETTEDIDDCTGEEFLFELLTAQFARLNIDMDFDPDVFAGIAAFGYGAASAPSAGSDEVQTETITATGGTRTLTTQIGTYFETTAAIPWNAGPAEIQAALEALLSIIPNDIVVTEAGNTNEVQTETVSASGGTRTITVINPRTGVSRTTANIAFDANAATIQAALELLDNVGAGDIVVAGAGPYTYTFAGQEFNGNVSALTSDDTLLTGGGSSFAETTPGVLGTRIYTFSGVNFQEQDVNLLGVDTFALTGGTSTIVVTTGGVGLSHSITRLGAGSYTLPLMTLYVGFRGSDKQPVIFKNVVVNSFRIRSISRERIQASIELIGSAELEFAVGYTMPECQDIMPLRFGDCQMSINGTDYIASELGREFEYYFQNDVTPKFDGAGIYSTRHERADKRPSGYNLFILGEPGDSVYNYALARSTGVVFLRVGLAGRHIKCTSPQALVKLVPAGRGIRFGGDPPESEVAIMARPKKVSGDATTPTTITAVIAQTATLLTPA